MERRSSCQDQVDKFARRPLAQDSHNTAAGLRCSTKAQDNTLGRESPFEQKQGCLAEAVNCRTDAVQKFGALCTAHGGYFILRGS